MIEPYLSWRIYINEADSVMVASEIQERYRISYRDALIIYAASRAGATVLYSEGLNPGQIMQGVEIVNPLLDTGVQEPKAG